MLKSYFFWDLIYVNLRKYNFRSVGWLVPWYFSYNKLNIWSVGYWNHRYISFMVWKCPNEWWQHDKLLWIMNSNLCTNEYYLLHWIQPQFQFIYTTTIDCTLNLTFKSKIYYTILWCFMLFMIFLRDMSGEMFDLTRVTQIRLSS